MPKLTKRAIRYVRNYRKAVLLKRKKPIDSNTMV